MAEKYTQMLSWRGSAIHITEDSRGGSVVTHQTPFLGPALFLPKLGTRASKVAEEDRAETWHTEGMGWVYMFVEDHEPASDSQEDSRKLE